MEFSAVVGCYLYTIMESDPIFDEAAEDVPAASICAFHVADRRMAIAHYNVRANQSKPAHIIDSRN